MLACRAGTASASARSTCWRRSSARPSVQPGGRCMCRPTKRRWPDLRVITWSKRTSGWPPWCSVKRVSTASIAACSCPSTATSISPCTERRTSFKPSQTMFSATAMASTGSSQSQPVTPTSTRPSTTPAEVQTSVSRCRASASSVIERCMREARSITQASMPLSADDSTESPRPQPSCSRGCGSARRGSADQMMAAAAPKIRMPSKPAEKYSALSWPNGWSSSAGRSATVTIHRPNSAAARFTSDSIASDSRPTEPVTHQAPVLSAMVSRATTTDTVIRRRGVSQGCEAEPIMAAIVRRACRLPIQGQIGSWRLPHKRQQLFF